MLLYLNYSLTAPKERNLVTSDTLRNISKWTSIGLISKPKNFNSKQFKLKDLFTIKRGRTN